METGNDMRDLTARVHAAAVRAGACAAFTGRECTPDGIFGLFLSPAGREFCTEHDFPDMDLWREAKGFGAEDFGIYIDAGDVTLTDPETVALIGDTRATVVCDRLDTVTHRPCRVILLQGASACITATDWAMVFVEAAAGCRVTGRASGHARILGLKRVDGIVGNPPFNARTE